MMQFTVLRHNGLWRFMLSDVDAKGGGTVFTNPVPQIEDCLAAVDAIKRGVNVHTPVDILAAPT